MELKLQQRASIKFCVLLDKTPTETFEMVQQAYKDQALGKTQVFEWHKRFKGGHEDLEDSPRPGRPVTAKTEVNINTIESIVREGRITIAKVADIMHLSVGTVDDIIRNNLGYRRVAAK